MMEVRNNMNLHGVKGYAKQQAFKGAYTPRDYRGAREFAERVYDNTKGTQKALMWLKKNSGENLNNIITAFGTACVAPIFITYNRFSKEDKDTKKYSALRQPISAIIALGLQLPLMSVYNKWVDRHSYSLGVEGMDLKAKPPVSVLKPKASAEYKLYKAECIRNGETAIKKDKWVNKRVLELQDEAYYKELKKLRANPKFIDNVDMKELVKTTKVEDTRDLVFKDYLIKHHGFTAEELADVKKYNDLDKKYKGLLKKHNLKLKDIKDPVWEAAEKKAIEDLQKCIDAETDVKFKTSQYFDDMKSKINIKKSEVLKEHSDQVNEASKKVKEKTAQINKAAKELLEQPKNQVLTEELEKLKSEKEQALKVLDDLEKNAQSIVEKGYSKIKKEVYEDCIAQLENTVKNSSGEDKNILGFVLNKIKKAGSIDNIKYHGGNRNDVERSVKIKKFLVTSINEAETKLKTWKDRSGMLFGLMILPLICGVLNYAYPRIMEHFFPELSAAKKASKAKAYGTVHKAAIPAKSESGKEVK